MTHADGATCSPSGSKCPLTAIKVMASEAYEREVGGWESALPMEPGIVLAVRILHVACNMCYFATWNR